MRKDWWKSRTFWGALVIGAARVVVAPDTPARVEAAIQAGGLVLAAVGVRDAIAKNGKGE